MTDSAPFAPFPNTTAQVRRRHVFYLPGYDPIPPRRYRELYRREGTAQARIAGYDLTIGPREKGMGDTKDPRGRFGWTAQMIQDGQTSRAEIEVMVWADLVQSSMNGSIPATYLQLLRTSWAYIASGALWRLMRLRRGPVIAALYPIVMLLMQLALSLAAGVLAGRALMAGLGHPGPGVKDTAILGAAVLGGMAVTAAGLWFWRRMDGRLFAYYLMHDYAFTAAYGGAYPPALDARIRDFAHRIVASVGQSGGDQASVDHDGVDEVLLVGHSSGAYLGVSVLAEAMAQLPATARVSFLTLGHVVPMASFLPGAARLRADLRSVAGDGRVTWVDVSAPGDPCCFGLCDPVAVSRAEPAVRSGPLVLSAAFRRTLTPARFNAMKWRWFRLHFQYLCAFDCPQNYDYFAITAGPLTLGQRFAGRAPSPGRITTPANRWSAP